MHLVAVPVWNGVEEFVTGIGGVPDDVACSTQTSPVVKVLGGWELGTSDGWFSPAFCRAFLSDIVN